MAAGQPVQPAVKQQVAIAPGRLAGGGQAVAEAEFAAEIKGRRVRIKKTVGAGLHTKAVALKGADFAAEMWLLFENHDLGGRQTLLQAISQRQPRYAAADDHNTRHSHKRTLSSNRCGNFASTTRRTSGGLYRVLKCADNQFVLKAVGSFNEVVQVHVAELVNLLPAVIRPDKTHLRYQDFGLINRRMRSRGRPDCCRRCRPG